MITYKKARIPYLDFLKFFAIASVLLGHSVEQITGNDFWDNPIWSFIYTYHMPLFMLLCGYFFGSSLKLPLGELAKKKFVQLVIPSISAFIIMYAFVALTGFNPCPELMDFSWFGFFNAVWFLKCVFFCYLIGYITIKLLRSLWAAALVSVILVNILPFGDVDNVNFMLPMFWLGYFCEKEQEVLTKHRAKLLIASVIAFAALLPFWSGRLTVYMVPIRIIDWTSGTFDFENLNITVFRMVIGMVGSMVFFLLAPWVYAKIENLRITPTLNNLGKCTLGLYWVQTFLLECTLHALGFYVSTAGSFLAGPVIAVIEMTLCYQVVLLLKKNRYTRLLLLGENNFK